MSVENYFFDRSDVEGKKLLKALARHAQCWEDDEIDPYVAAAYSLYVRVVAEAYSRVSVENVFDGRDLGEERLREALARHAQC